MFEICSFVGYKINWGGNFDGPLEKLKQDGVFSEVFHPRKDRLKSEE